VNRKARALRLDFDRRLMLRFRGSVITSDSGLLAYGELDEVLALTTSGGERLAEARTGKNRRHLMVDPRDVIIDAKTGNIDATVHGIGAGDEVWYNPGDGNYYATGSGSPERALSVPFTTANPARGSTPAAVVDAKDKRVLQQFPTYNVPAVSGVHPSGTSHSIAANAANNLILVPFPANNAVSSPDWVANCLTGCLAVFGHADEDHDHDH
jgi:hypothetical protein